LVHLYYFTLEVVNVAAKFLGSNPNLFL